MDRFALGFASGLLLVAAGLAGCGGSGVSLLTGAKAGSPEDTGSLKPDDPMTRPAVVAWTSARAQRCGFNFDPGKLRATYLAFEARQSPPDQLAQAEKIYDTTYKTIRTSVGADPDYCTDGKSAAIKKDLTRHLAGDFKPDLPPPKKAETCGFFGCTETSESKEWDQKKFWDDMAKTQR